MKILFTGGGTMGSVTPLIAVAEVLKDKDPSNDFYWLGTHNGPEKEIIKNYNMEFKAICAGKLRRYFSWLNFLDIFKVMIGLGQSIFWLLKWRPQVIVSAGGFTAVPVVWAGWLLGIPSLIHQQDVRVGLANKLCAKCAKQITVCFPGSVKYYNSKKTMVVGNPVRSVLKNKSLEIIKKDLYKKFNLDNNLPLVLIVGGGTGSMMINNLVSESLKELVQFCQIIHLTGKSKIKIQKQEAIDNYYQFDFVFEIIELLQAADVIVSRAGMGSLTEIAYFKKPAIIIPLADSHQEDNANYFADRKGVIILNQKEVDQEKFIQSLKELLADKNKMKELGQNVHQIIKWQAEERIANLILDIANKNK